MTSNETRWRRALLPALLLASLALPAAAGELLVGNKSANTLWRLSLDDGRKIGEAGTGPGPHEIAVSPDGRQAVVSEYGHQAPGHTLSVYDTRDGKRVRQVDLGKHGRPHGLRFEPDGHHLLVTTEASNSLLRVDLRGGAVVRAYDIGPGTGHMVALSADGRTAYVTKISAGTLVRVDLLDGAVLEKPAGAGAEGVAVARDHTVWVTNRAAGTVTVHDPRTLDVLDTLDSAGFPIRVAFTPSGRHALVTNARAGTLSVFDAVARRPVANVQLADPEAEYRETMLGRAALPIGAIVDPSGLRAYVAISGGNEIAVVDTATWTVVDRWQTGDEPDALGIVAGPAPREP